MSLDVIKRHNSIFFAVSVAVVVISLVLMIVACAGDSAGGVKAFSIIACVVGIFIGCALGALSFLTRDTDANFFLFDNQIDENIPLEELDFDRVNSRLDYLMATFSSEQSDFWEGNIFDESGSDKFGVAEVYKPLVAYKMLYDLTTSDDPDIWKLFNRADVTLIDSLNEALNSAGEDAMCRALRSAYDSQAGSDDIEWFRDFVVGNTKYMRRRMIDYVRKNINLFY